MCPHAARPSASSCGQPGPFESTRGKSQVEDAAAPAARRGWEGAPAASTKITAADGGDRDRDRTEGGSRNGTDAVPEHGDGVDDRGAASRLGGRRRSRTSRSAQPHQLDAPFRSGRRATARGRARYSSWRRPRSGRPRRRCFRRQLTPPTSFGERDLGLPAGQRGQRLAQHRDKFDASSDEPRVRSIPAADDAHVSFKYEPGRRTDASRQCTAGTRTHGSPDAPSGSDHTRRSRRRPGSASSARPGINPRADRDTIEGWCP